VHSDAYQFAFVLLKKSIFVFRDILVHAGAYQFASMSLEAKFYYVRAYRCILVPTNLLQIKNFVFQGILVHTSAYQFANIVLKIKTFVLHGILLHTGAYRRIPIFCNLSQNLLFIPVPTNVLRIIIIINSKVFYCSSLQTSYCNSYVI